MSFFDDNPTPRRRSVPRKPIKKRYRGPSEDGIILGIGCGAFLLWAAMWITIIIVAIHFISKWW